MATVTVADDHGVTLAPGFADDIDDELLRQDHDRHTQDGLGPVPSCRLCQQTIYCTLDDERHPERRYQRPHAILLDSDLACLHHDASPRRYDGPGRLRAEGIDSEASERHWQAHVDVTLARAEEEDGDS